MRVARLDGAVLVGDASVVAGRRHLVMRAQRLIPLGLILQGVTLEIVKGCREAVAAMLERRTAQGPQRVLQSLRQRDKAFTAEHHLGMTPAAERQAKMVEPVLERLAGDADTEFGGGGEVRQALLPRRMLLAKDHLLLRAVLRLPTAHPTLERAPDAAREAWVPTAQLTQDSDRAQAGRCL